MDRGRRLRASDTDLLLAVTQRTVKAPIKMLIRSPVQGGVLEVAPSIPLELAPAANLLSHR